MRIESCFKKNLIYRVSHLNLSPPITRLGGQVSKKVSCKSCMVSRGNQNGVPFNFWFWPEVGYFNRKWFFYGFLNGTPYILLHIFIAYLESFPKHYNKTFFH